MGGYNIFPGGRPSGSVEVLPEPEVLYLGLRSGRFTFSELGVHEAERVSGGDILAKDPDNYAVPLLALRTGTMRLKSAEKHIVLEDVAELEEHAHVGADDCQDVISNEKSLGKRPGQDVLMGELTLPLMKLLNTLDATEKVKLTNALGSKISHAEFEHIRRTFLGSDALRKTKEAVLQYAGYAKGRLSLLKDSDYK
jgi:hypothetical protein